MIMLTQERLKQLIHYNPETGICLWKVNLRGPVKVGHVVGNTMKNGYRQTQIDGKKYLVHVLIWFYVTGQWPKVIIDHENRNGGDNSWANLREATMTQNLGNQSLSIANKSGFKGVFGPDERGKWRASIQHQYKQRLIGRFDTKEEAAAAYARVAAELFGEFAHPAAA